jgi:glycosyltransferase involved in cell wall biosynthesis
LADKNNLKILHFGCPYLPYKGGSTKRLLNLVRENDPDKSLLYLATPSLATSPDDDFGFEKVWRDERANSLMPIFSLLKFIYQIRPKIVVIHNSRALFTWNLLYRWFFPNVKIIVEIHSFRMEGRINEWLTYFLYERSDLIVVLSKASKKFLADRVVSTPIEVIYNGVEIESNQKKYCDYDKSAVTFAYVGSFHAWQGVLVIADAISNVKNGYWDKHSIIMLGDGPEFKRVKALTLKLESENKGIVIKSWVDQTYIDNVMQSVDFLLAPRPSTLATETVVPLKVVDSFRYNVPLISTNVEGLKELLVNEVEATFFIDKNNPTESLVQFMEDLPDLEQYSKTVDNLKRLGEGSITWGQSALQYYDLYKKLAN